MYILHRSLLVTLVMVVLLFGLFFIHGERTKKIREQWEVIQTEHFTCQIARTGRLTKEDYVNYVNALDYTGSCLEIKVEEYQKEENISGGVYFCLVSSEEIRKELGNYGIVYFRPESIVKVKVYRLSGKKSNLYECIKTVEGKK